jgi:hypothetical protein
MRGKRFAWIAIGAFAVIVLAWLGAGTLARTPTVGSASSPTASTKTSDTATAPDKYDTARYCQRLDNGTWVTNVSAYSTTRCVPEPSYATGDEAADGSQAIPRCFTCKLSDWKRAEQKRAEQATAQPTNTSNGATADPSAWSPALRDQVVGTCTTGWGGNPTVCGCVVTQLARQVPAYEASWLSSTDPRVQAAASACDPAGN